MLKQLLKPSLGIRPLESIETKDFNSLGCTNKVGFMHLMSVNVFDIKFYTLSEASGVQAVTQ